MCVMFIYINAHTALTCQGYLNMQDIFLNNYTNGYDTYLYEYAHIFV